MGNIFKILGKVFNSFLRNLYAFGQILIAVKSQILKVYKNIGYLLTLVICTIREDKSFVWSLVLKLTNHVLHFHLLILWWSMLLVYLLTYHLLSFKFDESGVLYLEVGRRISEKSWF